MNAAQRRKAGAGRTLLITLAVLVALVFLGFVGLVLLIPADQLRAQFERRVSEATGYTVTVGDLKLGWAGFGVALTARDLKAVSGDGSQTLTAPDAVLHVALGPLLRRQVELRKAKIDGALLRMGPPTRPAPPDKAPAGGAGDQGGGFIAPKIEITNSTITQEGTSGTTTLFGVAMDGSFELKGGDAGPTGVFKGEFQSDSTAFAPRATPDKPLRLPSIDLDFETSMVLAPQSATTRIDGRWGDWPGKGTIESLFDPKLKGWRNSGQFTLEPIDVKKLEAFAEAAGPAMAAYELGGRLEEGRVRFETRPGEEEMEYDFTTSFSGIEASLPGKGQVVRNGRGEIHIRPDNLNFKGEFAMGRADLDLDAHVTEFAAPKWTANVALKGPLEEALRFLPPEQAIEATGGSIDADLKLAGQVGQKGLPQATGTVSIREMGFKHPALAVPVDRLDVTLALLWNSARIENGFVAAGKSSAHFAGSLADFTKPEAVLNVDADALDLDQLLPEKSQEAEAASPAKEGAAAAVPVSGRITIGRLTKDRLTLTNLAGSFSAGAAGIELKDVSGQAYGGRTGGNLTLTPAAPGRWEYSGNFFIGDANAGEILAALTPIRGLEGRLRTRMQLAGTTGPGIDAVKALTLVGAGLVLDGTFVNIPAVQKVSSVLKFKEGASERIEFKSLRHRVKVENGFVVLDTLKVSQASADWDLGGRIGIDGSLDCPVTARLDPKIFEEGSDYRRAAEVLAGPDGRLALTFRLTGSVTNPDVQVDLSPLTEAAKQTATDALKDELKKRLGGFLKKH